MPEFNKAKGFAAKFMGRSPFKHGDGSGVSPAGEARLDIKKAYSKKHGGSMEAGSDEEFAAYQAELANIKD